MLENLSRRIPDLPSIVLEKNQRLDEWFERYVRSSVVFLERQQHLLNAIKIPSALKNVEQAELQLEKAIQPLTTSFATSFSEKEQALKWQAMLLSQNSYQRTLEKGFCLVEGDKGVVRSAQTLKAMKEANIHFADGKVRVQPLKEQKTLF